MAFFSLLFASAFANTMTAAEYVAAPANPINAQVELAAAHTVALISAKDGGRLSFKTSQGDTVELVFPKGALTRDTRISLREIQKIQSSVLPPLDSQRSIQLQPQGLELLKPATLIFKLKKPLDLKKATPIYSTSDGRDLSFASMLANSNTQEIHLGISHFSNYGVIESLTVDEIIANGFTQMGQLRLSNWITHQIEKAKKTGADLAEVTDRAFTEGYDNVVYPALMNAQSCKATQLASQHFLGWMRQVELLGGNANDYMPNNAYAELSQVMNKNLRNCFPDLVKACYQDHRPIEVMQQVFAFLRTVALLGGDDPFATSPAKEYLELQDKCGNFRFFMNSEFWVGDTREDGHGIVAGADFNFKLSPFYEEPISGPIEVQDLVLNAQGFICERTVFATQPAQVMLMPSFLSDVALEKPGSDVTVLIGNLVPLNSGVFQCRSEDDPQMKFEYPLAGPYMSSYWGGLWIGTHGPTGLNEMLGDAFFALKGWEIRNDKRWMHKTYLHTVEQISENTEITIYHEPKLPAPSL